MKAHNGRLSVGLGAAAATRAAYRQLRRRTPVAAHLRRTNYAGRGVELYGGLAVAAGAAAAMAAATGISVRTRIAAVGAALAAGACGAYDDQKGSADERGFGTHLRALRERRLTSGGVKLLGIGAAGLAAGILLKARPLDQVLAGVVVAGTAHAVNLVDVAPGRAAKAVIAAGLPGLLRARPRRSAGLRAPGRRGRRPRRRPQRAHHARRRGRARAGRRSRRGRRADRRQNGAAAAHRGRGRAGRGGRPYLHRRRLWNAPVVRHVDAWGRLAHPYG